MTVSELANKFNYSTIDKFSKATGLSASGWRSILSNKRLSKKAYVLEDQLRQRSFEIYLEKKNKIEKEYYEREKIIKQLKTKKFNTEDTRMEWINVVQNVPNNGEQVVTFDGLFYTVMYYYRRIPNEFTMKEWKGEGFYSYTIDGVNKIEHVVSWARMNT